jgi:hypothetical protein
MTTTDKTTDRLSLSEETFRKLVLDQYDLEDDFVNNICGYFRTAAEPLLEGTGTSKRGARSGTSRPKKQRKKSAYNVYVREMMKTEDIQKLNHKEKMGAIAALWKGLSDPDRTPYASMADTENTDSTAEIV